MSSTAAETPGRGALRANRNYRRYFAARTASMSGSQLTYAAVPILALTLYRSPVAASLVTASQYVATVVFGPFAGAWADRADQRTAQVAADAARAVIFAGLAAVLALRQPLPLAAFCLAAVANSACAAVFDSAATAYLARLVPGPDYPRAVSRSESTGFAVSLAGPVLGAALFTVARWLPFAADAATYVASLGLVLRIDRRGEAPIDRAATGSGLLRLVRGGAAYVVRDRVLGRAVLLLAVQSFVLSASVYLLVAGLVRGHGGSVEAGAVLASQAVGGLAGAVVAARAFARWPGFRLTIVQNGTWIAVLAAGAVAVHLVGGRGLFVAGTVVLALLWLPVTGARLAFAAHVNTAVAGPLRGRSFAFSRVAASFATVWGPPVGGALAGAHREAPGLLGLAALTLAAGALTWRGLAGASPPAGATPRSTPRAEPSPRT